jgi:uncharacterized protein (TIGR03067 family)
MIRFLALVVAMMVGGLALAQQPQQPPGKQPPTTQPTTPTTQPGDKDKPAATDVDKLAGTWAVTSLSRNGQSDEEKLKTLKLKVTFTKDRELRYQVDGKDVARATFRLEPPGNKDADPRIITTSVKGHDERGLYRLKDDGLELCLAQPGAEYPADFKSTGNTLITFKREKETPAKPAGAEKKPDEKKPDEKKPDEKKPDEKKETKKD